MHEKRDLLHSSILDVQLSTILNGKQSKLPVEGIIESDADAQLLIRLVFKQRVNVETVVLVGSAREVRFFANLPTLDFSEVEEATPAKVVDLEISGNGIVPLGGTRFSRIASLEIFVASNCGEVDVTVIEKLEVAGTLVDLYH